MTTLQSQSNDMQYHMNLQEVRVLESIYVSNDSIQGYGYGNGMRYEYDHYQAEGWS